MGVMHAHLRLLSTHFSPSTAPPRNDAAPVGSS